MKYLKWLSVSCIIITALILRLYHFENRTQFEWDQNRDYGEVKKIASGEYVPLGPIAKGTSGGFYLGSLYYYLLTPAYMLMDGNLRALPITSIVLDALVAGLIYMLFKGIMGRGVATSLAFMWTISWFLIETSRISWNVALIPLWSVCTLSALYNVLEHRSVKHFYLLAFLAGLTLHIHVTTIPIIPLMLLLFIRRLTFPLHLWIKAGVVAIIPAIPLLTYDVAHSFRNLRLVKDFFTHRSEVTTAITEMGMPVLTKLGKVTSGILTAIFRDNAVLGGVVVVLSIAAWFSKSLARQIAALMVLIPTSLIILFRDYNFPEYYFSASYIAILVILATYTTVIATKLGKLKTITLIIAAIAILTSNLNSYTTEPTGFSLLVKEQIVETLTIYDEPIDINYNFDPGRDGGLRDLVRLQGIALDKEAKTRLLITDKLNTPLYIEGELARDLTQIGNIRSALYIVQ